MSEQFKVGDICIGQNHITDVENNGMECTILSDGSFYAGPNRHGRYVSGVCFLVRWADGENRLAMLYTLRKKHPPRSAKSIMREAILKAQKPAKVPA